MPWTVHEWCDRWRISPSTFYDMQKRKVGPEVTDLPGIRGKRITEEAETDWIALSAQLAKSKEAKREAQRRRQISSNAGRIAAESPLHVSRAGKKKVFLKAAKPEPKPKPKLVAVKPVAPGASR